jgi:nonsense-mediated mRNA decay protein 3
MRAKVALYRDPGYDPVAEAERRAAAMTDDEEGDMPEVPLEELLDELEALQIDEEDEGEQQQPQQGTQGALLQHQ